MFNFLAPVGTHLGYGKVGLNILNTAIRTGKEICYWPIGQTVEEVLQGTEPQYHDNIIQAVHNAKFFNGQNPSVRLWHQFDNSFHVGRKRFFFPIFELDSFNELETHHLKQADKVLVCSHWAKNIIKEKVGVPCDVVTLGVDKEIFRPMSLPKKLDKCIFLNIGKWEKRKGHDILLSLFQKAFPPTVKDVELWLSCNSPFADNAAWEKHYKQDPRVKIIPRVNTQEELVNLINRATYGIFPSRAEGWGLGMAEMMACGKKCLTTNFSGHTEFCTEKNSFLVEILKTEPANDGIWFHGQGNWAAFGEFEEEQFINHMRNMYKNREEYNSDLLEEFNWNRSLMELENACRGQNMVC